jgi:hypothetical protein
MEALDPKSITFSPRNMGKYGYDDNGLALSNATNSGYMMATLITGGKDVGKFLAYVWLPEVDELRELRRKFGQKMYYGYENVQGLAIYENVLDAAYVGQEFNKNLIENLISLYNGDDSVIATPPQSFPYGPAENAQIKIDIIQTKINNRPKQTNNGPIDFKARKTPEDKAQYVFLDIFNKNRGNYNITKEDVKNIRDVILMQQPERDYNDWLLAAELALEPYKK